MWRSLTLVVCCFLLMPLAFSSSGLWASAMKVVSKKLGYFVLNGGLFMFIFQIVLSGDLQEFCRVFDIVIPNNV